MQMPLASPNYLFELDRATQAVLAQISEAQAATGAAGADVTVAIEGAIVLVRVCTTKRAHSSPPPAVLTMRAMPRCPVRRRRPSYKGTGSSLCA
jgi:hypothetical protein